MSLKLILDQIEFCERFGIYHSSQNVAYFSNRESRTTYLVVQGIWYNCDIGDAMTKILHDLRLAADRISEPAWHVKATLKYSREKMDHLMALQEFVAEVLAGACDES